MTIIVVGAGVVGCAVAHELACRGADVRVIDSRGIGGGATRASAGMLAPHVEGHFPPLRTLGARSLALYDRFIARVEEDSGQPVEYERSGTLQVALDAKECDELCALARMLSETEVDHALLDPGETRRLEPGVSGAVTAALHVKDQGYVAAGPLTRALAAAAVRRGATMTTTHALAIEGGDRPRIVTSGGTMAADRIVVAAGSWAGAFEDPRQPVGHLKPIRGQLLELRLPARAATHIVWGGRCYAVPWRDGTVLAGATVEDAGFDESATVAGVRHLLETSVELLPGLAAASFVRVRVGLRPMTRDELPAIGPSSTMRHVFYATGHYRNGVLLAPLTAVLAADLVLEGRQGEELALVRPDRLGL